MIGVTDALVSTKLRPSQARPNLVARPRLTQRLERERGRKLTLISADIRRLPYDVYLGKEVSVLERAKGGSRNRGGRPRAGQELLSRERILKVALRVVDEEGMGALSMRRLGAELGVNPMSIYHHLPDKAAVIAGLVELVFSGMRVRYPDGSSWQEQVCAWAGAYRDLVRAHPNLVLEIVSNAAAVTEAVLLVIEPLYEALEKAGLPPAEVVRAADSVVDFIHGFAIAEGVQPLGDSFDRRELLERLEAGAAAGLPATSRVFSALTSEEARYDFDRGFDAGLGILLKGIEVSTVDAGHLGGD